MVVHLAPIQELLLRSKDPLIDIVSFEKGLIVLPSPVVHIKPYFQYFSDIPDHIDEFDLNKPSLVDVVIQKFRELGQPYFLFVIKPQTIVFV